jgi:hypothetical protein
VLSPSGSMVSLYTCACNCAQRKRLGTTLNSKLLALLGQSRLATQYNYWWPVGFLFWQEVLESQISIIQLKAQAETFTIRQKKKKKKKKKKTNNENQTQQHVLQNFYTTITFFY